MINQIICATASVCVLLKGLPEFRQIKSQREFMGQSQEIALSRECEEMNAEGKIQDLVREMNAYAQELSDLRDQGINRRTAERIHEIQQNLHDLTDRAQSILRPEWTRNKWPYKANWNIKFTNGLNIDERIIATNFAFEDFELETLTLEGQEREELYPLVFVQPQSQSIKVEIAKEASSLELCQMQTTLAIGGTIRYRFQNEVYTDYLDLTLRPGTYRVPAPPANPIPKPDPLPDIFAPPRPNPGGPDDIICRILNNCHPRIPPPAPIPWPIGPGPRGEALP
jgi:hypothetical protein